MHKYAILIDRVWVDTFVSEKLLRKNEIEQKQEEYENLYNVTHAEIERVSHKDDRYYGGVWK